MGVIIVLIEGEESTFCFSPAARDPGPQVPDIEE
ncbi:hypothetical protein HKBW3C_01685 [Candidatus Hakubella thermalkaliphila]|nr:hypothetical protein HKBW3C_01685 [Candidatus Hakubella thermalkaliphila]